MSPTIAQLWRVNWVNLDNEYVKNGFLPKAPTNTLVDRWGFKEAYDFMLELAQDPTRRVWLDSPPPEEVWG